jgi:predicted peroxiredoxin
MPDVSAPGQNYVPVMATNGRVIVGCSHGEEDPDNVVVAYLIAGAALDQGKDVVLWLTSEGVRLGLDGYADKIRADKDPPVARVHAQFIEKGGRFLVCPICFKERELDEASLVPGAELKGASPLMEFAGDGAMTFSY